MILFNFCNRVEIGTTIIYLLLALVSMIEFCQKEKPLSNVLLQVTMIKYMGKWTNHMISVKLKDTFTRKDTDLMSYSCSQM